MIASGNKRDTHTTVATNQLAQATMISMIARLNVQFHARNVVRQRDVRGWIMSENAQLNHTNNV
jgi:hypothetical protein